MKIFEPSYYASFRCIAADCPDSCCKEWDVQVDPDSAAKYRKLPGALGNQLRSVLHDDNGETIMLQQDDRCPMWQEDGLCQIQAQLGEEALCQVCRTFPRLRHDYGNFVELGLELSCPEAARLIFSTPCVPMLCRIVPEDSAPEYDPELMSILCRTRQTALALIQDRNYSINQALAVLLLYGYAVQEEIDGGEPAKLDLDAMLAEAGSLRQSGNMNDVLSFFSNLEILTENWRQRLNAPLKKTDWSDPLRNLANYAIERYWLQAISDYDIVCRVKFILLMCLAVKSLGGSIVQTAQLFSKEIENDADNVEAILDGVYTSPALTDVKLLDLLLSE